MIHKLSYKEQLNKHVEIEISGSKSESNRLLILQAFSKNISLQNISNSNDTLVLQKALVSNDEIIDIHHAGTAMRFLTAYFASLPNREVILTGSDRMCERPIKVLVDSLTKLGADIEYIDKKGFPPLRIKGRNLEIDSVEIKASVSSQYISALMLIAPFLSNGLKINLKGKIISMPYIEMTLSLLKEVGFSGDFLENKITIASSKSIGTVAYTIESDWSSASYFYSLVALSDSLSVTFSSYKENSFQGDSELVKIYKQFCVETKFNASNNTITISKKKECVFEEHTFNLINTPDLAQTIAVTCFGLGLGCKLLGLQTLKIKETDRLVALKNELEKLGAVVKISKNSLELLPSNKINSDITIETYNDHRMAMAFAPLAIKTNLLINDAGVVSKSYPNFWRDLVKTGVLINI